MIVSRIPFFFRKMRIGDIIAFRHSPFGVMIKKVEQMGPGQDEIYVTGTHEDSIDSRHFGAIHSRDLIGKVIWHVQKPTH